MAKVAIWGPVNDANWHAQARAAARGQFPRLTPEDNPAAKWTGVVDPAVEAVIVHPDCPQIADRYGKTLKAEAVVVLAPSVAQVVAKTDPPEKKQAPATRSRQGKDEE